MSFNFVYAHLWAVNCMLTSLYTRINSTFKFNGFTLFQYINVSDVIIDNTKQIIFFASF